MALPWNEILRPGDIFAWIHTLGLTVLAEGERDLKMFFRQPEIHVATFPGISPCEGKDEKEFGEGRLGFCGKGFPNNPAR